MEILLTSLLLLIRLIRASVVAWHIRRKQKEAVSRVKAALGGYGWSSVKTNGWKVDVRAVAWKVHLAARGRAF